MTSKTDNKNMDEADAQQQLIRGYVDDKRELEEHIDQQDQEIKWLKQEINLLEKTLANCRNAMPSPPPGSSVEGLWADAMSDAASVDTFVAASAEAMKAEIVMSRREIAALQKEFGREPMDRCDKAPGCACFDKQGIQVSKCITNSWRRAFHKLETEKAARDAEIRDRLGEDVCVDCEGEGMQGGQFCGGYWDCVTCNGTGKRKTP